VTWTAFNTGLTGLSTSLRILLAVHNDMTNNVVYADVINTGGTLSGVFSSTNQGGTWTSLGVPAPSIYPAHKVVYTVPHRRPDKSNRRVHLRRPAR